jgi:hypothetical protein
MIGLHVPVLAMIGSPPLRSSVIQLRGLKKSSKLAHSKTCSQMREASWTAAVPCRFQPLLARRSRSTTPRRPPNLPQRP